MEARVLPTGTKFTSGAAAPAPGHTGGSSFAEGIGKKNRGGVEGGGGKIKRQPLLFGGSVSRNVSRLWLPP